MLWWKQVVQWTARAGYDGVFVDNAYFTSCWNHECQEGYRAWLKEHYTAQEIRRYFTITTNNLLYDPSIETNWIQEIPGQWRAAYWGSSSSSAIYPDTDAYAGRYACRIESASDDTVAVFSHATQKVPADQDLRLTFYYRTAGTVLVKLIIELAVAKPLVKVLDVAGGWTQATIDFHTLAVEAGEVNFYMRFEVQGVGKVWLDEFWLGRASSPPEYRVELEPTTNYDITRLTAAAAYWSSVAEEKLGYLRAEARTVNPTFELFTNGFHAVNVDYFMSEQALVPGLDLYRQRHRKDVGYYPGVYRPSEADTVLVANCFGYKYIHSLRRPDTFSYHMPHLGNMPHSTNPQHHYHNADSVLLNLAEAAAFGDGAGCDAGVQYVFWNYTLAQMAQIRTMERHFWAFVQNHTDLYEGYQTYADVGIVFHDLPDSSSYGQNEFVQLTDMVKDLAGHGVLWDVLTENRCDSTNLSRLRALVYQDVARISEAEVEAIQAYLEQGGLVIAAGVVGDADKWYRMRLPDTQRLWPPVGFPPDRSGERSRRSAFQQKVGAGTLVYQPGPLGAEAVIAALQAHLGRSAQLVGNLSGAALKQLRLNAWTRPGSDGNVVLHVVNYDVPLGIDRGGQMQLLENVQVQLPLPSDEQVQSVTLYSPEPDILSDSQVEFSLTASGMISFTIPRMRIYTIAVLKFSHSLFLPLVEKSAT
jgi:hypothetical protein